MRRLLLFASLCLVSANSVRAAEIVGPTRSGLPGLWETLAAPNERSASLRLSLHFEQGTVDPGHGFSSTTPLFGAPVQSRELRLALALHASRNVLLAASIPYRMWDSDGVVVRDTTGSYRSGQGNESGLGDAEMSVAARFFDWGPLRAGGYGRMRVPTGSQSKGLGSGQVEGEFGFFGSTRVASGPIVPEAYWHNNVAWRLNKNEQDGFGVLDPNRSPAETGVWPLVYPGIGSNGNETDNDALLLRTGIEFRRRWGHIFMELSSDWFVAAKDISFRESPHWFTPGVYLGRDDGIALKASWAIGLWADDASTAYTPSYPDWVFTAGLSIPMHLGGRDRDLDGVPDSEDLCPEEPEDVDGYRDEDGCPDLDNDGDGIPDLKDLAPNMAEDPDGFEDEDGRPDRDNDLDGIVDELDQCPLQAEDFDGFQDEDGCPDLFVDRDGDGIEDALDACPLQAEDFDGFEDDDGCPELDNDLDGIVDELDQCPNEAEDYDGVDDDDGCPDS